MTVSSTYIDYTVPGSSGSNSSSNSTTGSSNGNNNANQEPLVIISGESEPDFFVIHGWLLWSAWGICGLF